MSEKFHVNPKTGDYGRCRATKRPCPLGGSTGEENHYSTRGEAVEASEKLLSEQHGAFIVKKQTKYADEDWSKIPSPADWDTTASDGLDVEDNEQPYWNYHSDNVGYRNSGVYVSSANMKKYVASYMGLHTDDLPQSVTDLIEDREELWLDEGFDAERIEDADEDGRYAYLQVIPPSRLQEDLEEHYYRMTEDDK